MQQKKKLLDIVREKVRVKHYRSPLLIGNTHRENLYILD